MILVIVESPSKSKTIAKYLGKDYKVVASVGHIRDLEIGNPKCPLGVDVENNFEPYYEISKTKINTVKSLKTNVEKADEVYLATDPDREGEAISYHLASVLNLDLSTTKRLEFHEITRYAVNNAITNPRTIDMNLVHSQETRRIVDRILGFDLSQLTKKKIGSKSAGRVQSVVLKLIVDKEKEIEAFVEQTYYVINGYVKIDGKHVKVNVVNDQKEEVHFESEEEALKAVDTIVNHTIQVQSVVSEERKAHSYPVYTTSTMQQDASILLKFDSKKTMKLAQTLYEGIELEKGKGQVGLITYMRTDSVRVSPMFINSCKKSIEEEYGTEYVGVAKVYNKPGEKVQDAHEGIRPTDINVTPEMVEKAAGKEEAKLYQLIYSRAKASMMKDELYLHDEITFKAENYTLLAKGEKTTFDGFTKEYKKIRENKREALPVTIHENSVVEKAKLSHAESKTKAPSRYSEARLIQTMEKEGIGRPSTYASTISIIKQRDYVHMNRGFFVPTEQGKITIDLLDKWFPTLINVKYTSKMETELDKIAENELQEVDVLRSFYDDFKKLLVDAKKGISEEIAQEPQELIDYGNCPKCGKPLVKRKSRYGEFLACSGYPECKYIYAETKTGKECPECHKGTLVQRSSKFGRFYACSCYPECKYTEK